MAIQKSFWDLKVNMSPQNMKHETANIKRLYKKKKSKAAIYEIFSVMLFKYISIIILHFQNVLLNIKTTMRNKLKKKTIGDKK